MRLGLVFFFSFKKRHNFVSGANQTVEKLRIDIVLFQLRSRACKDRR